jgi:hypothetical protein
MRNFCKAAIFFLRVYLSGEINKPRRKSGFLAGIIVNTCLLTMDLTLAANPDTLERVRETVTPEFLERLTHYALRKLGQKWWRGVWDGKIPGGVQPEDLAISAIEAVLIGDPDQGGRSWDRQKDPDLMKFLRDIIDSKASHLVERAENAREREPHPAEGESVSDFLDRKRDHRSLSEETLQISAEDEVENERLFFALLDEVKGDPLLPKILECEWDGIYRRAEVAAKLGVDVNAITQAKKRLDRILPEFRQKHSQSNPFKTR